MAAEIRMPAKVNLRAELAVGRNAFHPGRVCEVVEWIADAPRRVPALIELMWDDDAGVAGRAADVLERITRDATPVVRRAVEGYKDEIIGLLSDARSAKLRWNLALTIPRLTLTAPECRRVSELLKTWLDDASSIVKTTALHAMADLTRQDPESLPEVLDLLRMAGRSGTPAMRARSRILLKALDRPECKRQQRGSLHMFD
jgi:HEAT repeat protein